LHAVLQGELLGGLAADAQHGAVAHEGEIAALAVDARLTDRQGLWLVGHVLAGRVVQGLGLEEHDGVRIADRADGQCASRPRPRGDHHLEPGDVRVVLLLALRVVLERPHAAAIGHAHHHLTVKAPLGALAIARGVVLDLVEALERESRELDLADGLEPVEGHPHRGADDAGLGEGAVDDAIAPERAVQILGDAEDAAIDPHVLADHEHVGIALHLLVERQVQRLPHVQFCHRLFTRWPRIGGGAAGWPSWPAGRSAPAFPTRSASSARWASRSGVSAPEAWSNMPGRSAAAAAAEAPTTAPLA